MSVLNTGGSLPAITDNELSASISIRDDCVGMDEVGPRKAEWQEEALPETALALVLSGRPLEVATEALDGIGPLQFFSCDLLVLLCKSETVEIPTAPIVPPRLGLYLRECSSALCALERPLSCVYPAVPPEGGDVGEGPAALLALVGPLARVGARVKAQVVGAGEAAAASLARVRSLSCVRAQMNLESRLECTVMRQHY